MSLFKPCETCGVVTEKSRCPEHTPKPTPRPKHQANTRDYDYAWKQLSRRARRAQPFCLWCGSTWDLQTDHTPIAWERKLAGKPIRIQDVRVLCGPCNVKAGQARPGPGQRTSEDRPEPEQILPATGRLLRGGGYTQKSSQIRPPVRQSLGNSPEAPLEHGLIQPW